MKNVVKYGALGIALGAIGNGAIYFLGSIVECSWAYCTCEFFDGTIFGSFWSWDTFFACFVITSLGCWILGVLYGCLSKGDEKIKFNAMLAFIVTLILLGVYLLTVFSMNIMFEFSADLSTSQEKFLNTNSLVFHMPR